MSIVHFVVAAKGGVGKSFISAVLAQYLKGSCRDLRAYRH